MSKKKVGKLHPIIPSILYRNQVTLLSAAPYAGKSRMCLKLAAQLALGHETMFGQFPPLSILYCSERDWDFTTTQFQATTGYDEIPDNLEFFCVPNIPKANKPAFRANPLAYLSKHIIKEPKPDVTVFDTIADFQSQAAISNTSDYGANRTSVMNIQGWALEHYLSVLALTHMPKENEKTRYKDPISRSFGSISIVASTAAVFIMEPTDDTHKYISFYQKSHLARLEPAYRYFETEEYREVSQEEATTRNDNIKVTSLTDREIEVLECIPFDWTDYAQTFDVIQTKLDINRTNLANYIKRLVDKSQIAIDHGAEPGKLIRRFQLS